MLFSWARTFLYKLWQNTWSSQPAHWIQADFRYGIVQLIYNVTKPPRTWQLMEANLSGFVALFVRTDLYNCCIDAGLQSCKSWAPVRHRFTTLPQVGATGCRISKVFWRASPSPNIKMVQLEAAPCKRWEQLPKNDIRTHHQANRKKVWFSSSSPYGVHVRAACLPLDSVYTEVIATVSGNLSW